MTLTVHASPTILVLVFTSLLLIALVAGRSRGRRRH